MKICRFRLYREVTGSSITIEQEVPGYVTEEEYRLAIGASIELKYPGWELFLLVFEAST